MRKGSRPLLILNTQYATTDVIMRTRRTFLYRNGLSLTLVFFFILSITGQILSGWKLHNDELIAYDKLPQNLGSYLTSGHFIQATFENWESEFLQMAMYVLLTVWLRQQGSSESKHLEKEEEVDRAPDPQRSGAPWPVKKGGFILSIYKNSLSIAFVLLFVVSFILHATGSYQNYNEEQSLKGKDIESFASYVSGSRFWFESFQNWQSEFIAVLSIVVLSIFLRQKGSPESKPVDASMIDTGSG